MKTNAAALHPAALNHALRAQALNEGGTVFVRVLKNLGGGNYAVLIAGKKMTVKSDAPLAEKSSLTAKIKIDGQKIILLRRPATMDSGGIQKIPLPVASDAPLSGAAAAYLKKLGLIPDALSAAILSRMQELALPFDAAFAKRMYALAKKFSGKEKAAAEIALALKQKGLPADEDAVRALLENALLANDDSLTGESNAHSFSAAAHDAAGAFEMSARYAFKQFFDSIMAGSALLTDMRCGRLALFNHCGADKRESDFSASWIRIPFAFSYKKDGKEDSGSGCLNLLIKPDSQSLEKLTAAFSLHGHEYRFSLLLHKSKVRTIKFYASEEKAAALLTERLGVQFPAAHVEKLADAAEFYPAADAFYSVETSA